MNKKDILNKIKSLDGLNQDERAYLVNLVNTKKKYGLVWEDKPEDVEEQLRTKLPVLQEVKERAIINDAVTLSVDTERSRSAVEESNNDRSLSGVEVPNHILIEGDNLHALTALTFTHENKIDLIYIDPPYNTGNKDFIYNDHYVDKEDAYRHSKWISFMEKRLRIAHKLLKDDGVIFISIDDNEQAQLKIICDEVFTSSNFVATLPVIMNLKGNHDNYGFSDTHEYCLVYTASNNGCDFGLFDLEEEEIEKNWNEDDYGFWKKADTLRRTGQDAARDRRPKGWFPIFIENENKVYVTEDDKPLNADDYVLWPINDNGDELSWTWGKKKIVKDNHNLIVTKTKKGLNIYKKQRPQLGDIPTKKPKSIFYKPEYSTSTSTNELKKIFGKKVFDAPKPVPFIRDILKIGIPNGGTVLDFFAGSGTTLESVIRENEELSNKISSIVVTNNENNIAEEVTYERNKRVIQGYTNAKGEQVEGLNNNNLRYYKTAFVDREPSLQNKRQLTQLATELLCIKEDCYTEVQHQLSISPKQAQIFTNNNGKYLVAIYHSRNQLQVQEQLISWVESLTNTTEKVRLYAFSPEKEVLAEEFYEVADKVEVVPLPEAIYNTYLSTIKALKLDKKQVYNNNTAEA